MNSAFAIREWDEAYKQTVDNRLVKRIMDKV